MYRSIDCCKIHKKNGKVWIMNGNVGDFFCKIISKSRFDEQANRIARGKYGLLLLYIGLGKGYNMMYRR